MGWAQIIPAVISGIGTMASMSKADASEARMMEMIYKNRGMGAAMLSQMNDRLDIDRQYKMQQLQNEQLNRQIAFDERGYNRARDDAIRKIKGAERDWALNRQMSLDDVAKKEREFQIQQLLQNQNLSREERKFAEAQLRQLKSDLGTERSEDRRELSKYQSQLSGERAFDIGQLTNAQKLAQRERDLDLKLRGSMLDRTQQLSQDMELARQSLGPARSARFFDMSDVEDDALRRMAGYNKSLDRAVKTTTSEAVAGLMRKGMYGDTIGSPEFRPGSLAEDTLARITARAAGEYASTYDRSYDEAMKYITGGQAMEQTNQSLDMAGRGQLLDEVSQTYSSLPYEIQAAGLNAGSGVYDRNTQSAAHRGQLASASGYAPYMSLNSGIYDSIMPQSGIAATMNMPTAAYAGSNPSAIYKTTAMSDPGVSAFGQLASGLLGNGLSQASTNSQGWQGIAQSAGEGFGTALGNIDWADLFKD